MLLKCNDDFDELLKLHSYIVKCNGTKLAKMLIVFPCSSSCWNLSKIPGLWNPSTDSRTKGSSPSMLRAGRCMGGGGEVEKSERFERQLPEKQKIYECGRVSRRDSVSPRRKVVRSRDREIHTRSGSPQRWSVQPTSLRVACTSVRGAHTRRGLPPSARPADMI